MKIALRVLGALTEKQQLDEKDVAELRRLAPQSDAAETDELGTQGAGFRRPNSAGSEDGGRVMRWLLLAVLFASAASGQEIFVGGEPPKQPTPNPPAVKPEPRPISTDKASVVTVELKSGERIDGAFRRAASEGVAIEVAGQPVTIGLDKVRAIYFSQAPQKSTPAGSSATSLLQDAMSALTALRSVTKSGISYRDYSSRVLDARVAVDRYLNSPAKNEPAGLRAEIKIAFGQFELAAQAWSAQVSTSAGGLEIMKNVGTILTGDTELGRCQATKKFIADTRAQWGATMNLNDPAMIGSLVGGEPGLVWNCAVDHVNQAERLLTIQ